MATTRRAESFFTIMRRIRKNKMAIFGTYIVLAFVGIAIFAPWISPYNPTAQDYTVSLQGPTWAHPFGTDIYGRDVLSRVIYGARISLGISFVAVLVSVIIGTILGAIAGYFGGALDEIIMRTFDVFLAFPTILLAIAIIAILGPGMVNIAIAIAVYSIPQFARVSRGTVVSVKANEYVEAARSIGEGKWSILMRYILPNSIAPIIIQATLRMATAILSIAGLGFLGLGVQPPTPEWGSDLSLAMTYIQVAPYLGIFPGLAVFLVTMGFNYFGDGLNDALNPKLKDR
ncbi:ABC transporter permease [Mesoaciditoga lauensis]|uniref:ABC transporter permease n=1 Tax=Mesoaciditoga lauensis TaxID=1495039 RepID=UPI000565B4D7|nr:ABC transporter permease [Mesoaciditoga lauensis]